MPPGGNQPGGNMNMNLGQDREMARLELTIRRRWIVESGERDK